LTFVKYVRYPSNRKFDQGETNLTRSKDQEGRKEGWTVNPISSYDVVIERQRDLRRKARQARAARALAVTHPGGTGRSAVRRTVAHTLRRVAETLEPVA
jgi:hypothetical protein